MSAEPSRGSHAMMWTLVLLVALPVLYVLSVPLVVRYSTSPHAINHLVEVKKEFYRSVPAAVYYYQVPYAWLEGHTVLGGALSAYKAWWNPAPVRIPF